MKQASYRWKAEKRARVNRLSAREKIRKYNSKSSLTSLKTFDSCNEHPSVPTQLAIATMQYDCVILSKTDSIGFLLQKFKNNGKMNILKAILRYELSHFSAPIKVTSKQCDCVILSKSSGIANINPNHHNCARPALKPVSYTHLTLPTIYSV